MEAIFFTKRGMWPMTEVAIMTAFAPFTVFMTGCAVALSHIDNSDFDGTMIGCRYGLSPCSEHIFTRCQTVYGVAVDY